MAQQYWHCEFCDFTGESQNDIDKHEINCEENPDNKNFFIDKHNAK